MDGARTPSGREQHIVFTSRDGTQFPAEEDPPQGDALTRIPELVRERFEVDGRCSFPSTALNQRGGGAMSQTALAEQAEATTNVVGRRIIEALKGRVVRQALCHRDGPSYNDQSGDTTHNKAAD